MKRYKRLKIYNFYYVAHIKIIIMINRFKKERKKNRNLKKKDNIMNIF